MNYLPGDYYDNVDELDSDEFDEFDFNQPLYAPKEERFTDEQLREILLRDISNAAYYGRIDVILKHLQEGFAIDTQLAENYTITFLAVSTGNLELFTELLPYAPDLNQSRDGETLLMAAAKCPKTTSPYEQTYEIARCLVENSVDVNAINRKRMTALMYASSAGNLPIVELLLPLSDMNAIDNQGWSALFWAVNDNRKSVVAALLEAGCSFDRFDVRGCTAHEYAKSNGFTHVADMFPSLEPENTFNSLMHTYYTYHDANSCKFTRDMLEMLQAMKCERLQQLFYDSNLNLLDFLTLNEDKLIVLGVRKPYQQNRILGGLYRFHKHPYAYKSIPIRKREEVFTTFEVAESIFAALRHIVTMQASVRYLRLNVTKIDHDIKFIKLFAAIKTHINMMDATLKQLESKVTEWDRENIPADVIVPENQTTGLVLRVMPYAIIAGTLYLLIKKKLTSC